MEEQSLGQEIPRSTSSSPPLDHDEDHSDFSPVASPELSDSCIPPSSSALSDDLRRKIIKQVEHYFSDENLPTDKFMLKNIKKDVEGFVPIGIIASFHKMKKLTKDTSLVVEALKESTFLVVSSNGAMVKRLHPLPLADIQDSMVCTVLVENLPDNHSVENLRRVFGEAGHIKNITVRDPHDMKDPKKFTVAEKLISGKTFPSPLKLHALVEYESVKAAEKAVATLNNEQDWRYGLRVKQLKKTIKPGQQKKKVWRETEPERGSSSVQASEPAGNENNHLTIEQHDHSHDEEDVDHLSKDTNEVHSVKEKNGPKGRNRGRGGGRRQYHHAANGHGHGTQFSSHGIEPPKPPPGPKMPDGTRGFTLGRGRPVATN